MLPPLYKSFVHHYFIAVEICSSPLKEYQRGHPEGSSDPMVHCTIGSLALAFCVK